MRENFYLKSKLSKIWENERTAGSIEIEVATSIGDLWYMLSTNINNLDRVHLFSSESIQIPLSVTKFLKSKKWTKGLKTHPTGSSLDSFVSKLNKIINSIPTVNNNYSTSHFFLILLI